MSSVRGEEGARAFKEPSLSAVLESGSRALRQRSALDRCASALDLSAGFALLMRRY